MYYQTKQYNIRYTTYFYTKAGGAISPITKRFNK